MSNAYIVIWAILANSVADYEVVQVLVSLCFVFLVGTLSFPPLVVHLRKESPVCNLIGETPGPGSTLSGALTGFKWGLWTWAGGPYSKGGFSGGCSDGPNKLSTTTVCCTCITPKASLSGAEDFNLDLAQFCMQINRMWPSALHWVSRHELEMLLQATGLGQMQQLEAAFSNYSSGRYTAQVDTGIVVCLTFLVLATHLNLL